MRKILCLNILLFCTFYHSQVYQPVDSVYDPAKLNALTNYLEVYQTNFTATLTNLQLTKKKTVRGISKERGKMFEEMLAERSFFLDGPSEKYVQNILDEIIQKNNLSIGKQKILLTRETTPNAVSLGSGLFFVNISIFCKMDSKDEIKYIISHELAHQILKHFENSIKKDDAITNSDSFKEKLKVAKRSKTSSVDKMLDLMRDYQYNDKKESRTYEQEADELGFTLFQKVAENPANAVVALKKLDSISPIEIISLQREDLQTFFATPNLKFNEEWEEVFGEGNYNYTDKTVNSLGFDSKLLRSHPDIEERISLIRSKNNFAETAPKNNSDTEFKVFQKKMINETLNSYYILKEYGEGLYFALQLCKAEPNNVFAHKMRGKFLKKLADARKDHTYKKVVEDVDVKNQTRSYYHYLAILENLSTTELEKLSAHYLQLNP